MASRSAARAAVRATSLSGTMSARGAGRRGAVAAAVPACRLDRCRWPGDPEERRPVEMRVVEDDHPLDEVLELPDVARDSGGVARRSRALGESANPSRRNSARVAPGEVGGEERAPRPSAPGAAGTTIWMTFSR